MTLQEPPVFNVGQGGVEWNQNWMRTPESPTPNLGATKGRGLGLVTPSNSKETKGILGSKVLLTAATLTSGWYFSRTLWSTRSFRESKAGLVLFVGSTVLTAKAYKVI
tara:strand:+ start:3471 stop:3794 length:324 start_codon:yes stop_codon:yes gene_type:complete